MSATAAPAKPKTAKRARDNKITRIILPALYDAGSKGLPINEVIDPITNKPVEALYFYEAAKGEGTFENPVNPLIVQTNEDVRTGKQGRPAKRWKLAKATRDRITKQRKRQEVA